MKQIFRLLLSATLFIFSPFCFSQNVEVDSLRALLKTDKEDTARIAHLNRICNSYELSGDLTEEMKAARQALEIAGKSKETEGIKRAVARTNNYIGNVYLDQGQYLKALDCYFLALKKNEETGNKLGMAYELGNIGVVYDMQGDYNKALDYDLKGLKLDEETGDQKEIITSNGNIGILYAEKGDYVHALEYLGKALKMAEQFGDKHVTANWLGNIGVVYDYQDNYAMALNYYEKALKLAEEIKDRHKTAIMLACIGSINTATKHFNKASDCIYKALAITDSLKAANSVKHNYELLSTLYQESNTPLPDSSGGKMLSLEQMRLRSLYYYKRSVAIRDTLFSKENRKQIVRKEMNYEFEKKEAETKSIHDKEMAISEAQNKKQKLIIWSVAGGLILVGLFSLIIVRSLQITRKQKRIIEIQKRAVERQKGEVERQKALVDEHQKEIIDSITYAKRLQDAILPPLDFVQKHLPDSFVLFKPKDIVAGDFYWMEVVDNIIFIAACDCTGHGVPGAMVSIVCSNALNRTVKEFGCRDTGKILDKVTDLVLETFEKGSTEVKDGMDISLMAIHQKTGQIFWSGANNPLWYISGGLLKEIAADKQPIGQHDNRKHFSTHALASSSGDLFFLFTDGYADQFGGPQGKKFKYRPLKEKLLGISNQPLAEQLKQLDEFFTEWKGNLEQVDDVCVIGIRI